MQTPRAVREKRWRDRAQRWVAPGDVFSPSGYAVDVLRGDTRAKAFVTQHHYSGSYPAARLAVGLFRSRGIGSELVGIAVFSQPMNQATVPKYSGYDASAGCELGRFVCDPVVAYNGETWFLTRAFAALRDEKPALRSIISYADPVERRDGATVVKPQHWGTIYQASNATFVGRSRARTLLYGPNGALISEHSLSKIRNEERGWQYASDQLVRAGAASRSTGESLAAWVARALTDARFTRVRHPGNLTYVFGLDRRATQGIRALHDGGLPYPKRKAA